jgi:hypothetical protein
MVSSVLVRQLFNHVAAHQPAAQKSAQAGAFGLHFPPLLRGLRRRLLGARALRPQLRRRVLGVGLCLGDALRERYIWPLT